MTRMSGVVVNFSGGGGGVRNTRVGYRAGAGAAGSRNVYVGARAGDASAKGDDNVVVGCDAMRTWDIGAARNVVVGTRSNAHASSCVVLGADNDVAARNVVCIGNDRVVTRPDTVVLGDASHTSFEICDSLVVGDRGEGVISIGGNARVGGAVACRSLALDDHWDARVIGAAGEARDLALVSRNGSVVSFNDVFTPGVLNFTGQHHCVAVDPAALRPGMVVVATGAFANLDGGTAPTSDEAVPVVEPCVRHVDPRVLGVVSRVVEGDDLRLAIGHIGFRLEGAGARRVVVNSAGEGGVLVCDAAGPIRNGDLLCAAGPAAPGHCCRQADDIVRSCTVAKATCDATFEEPDSVQLPGGGRARFVGCVYK